MKWHSNYIGVPFKSQGRDRRGVDCWGLVRLVYMHELGILLPNYGEISATDLIEVSRNITKGYIGENWEDVPINQVRDFDVCVMKFKGSKHIGHVGITIWPNSILHVEKGTDSVIIPANHYTIKHRIACFRRYKKVKENAS